MDAGHGPVPSHCIRLLRKRSAKFSWQVSSRKQSPGAGGSNGSEVHILSLSVCPSRWVLTYVALYWILLKSSADGGCSWEHSIHFPGITMAKATRQVNLSRDMIKIDLAFSRTGSTCILTWKSVEPASSLVLHLG